MKQAERDELLIRVDERTLNMEKKIMDMHEKVYGNGQEGLCKTVIKHDTTIKNVKWGVFIALTTTGIICTLISIFL